MDVVEDLDRYRAPALDKGLDILELLAATEEGLSQAEIAKSLERSANEIYRMLDRLVRRDYVRRTSADRYELTLKLFELAHTSPPIRRLVSQATPVLRRFAREAGQAVHLVIHDRNILVVVAQAMSSSPSPATRNAPSCSRTTANGSTKRICRPVCSPASPGCACTATRSCKASRSRA
jgi:DNA-binding IclR family transcriptional regulator